MTTVDHPFRVFLCHASQDKPIVFSLDSVITAVGMVDHIAIMIVAVILAAIVMIFVAGSVSNFVEWHPTVKMLALSFLLLIGFSLFVEAFHVEIPKGYIYFAMGFYVFVETLNLRVRARTEPVNLREAYAPEKPRRPQPVPVTVEAAAPAARSKRKSASRSRKTK